MEDTFNPGLYNTGPTGFGFLSMISVYGYVPICNVFKYRLLSSQYVKIALTKFANSTIQFY